MAGVIVVLAAMAAVLGYRVWVHRHVTWLRFHYFPFTFKWDVGEMGPLSPYYQQLPSALLKKLHWRAFYFLHTTNIKFRNYRSLTASDRRRLRQLLGVMAAQMTLFLPEKCFLMIHTILIHPEDYYSPHTKMFHKGDTNPRAGTISLSLTGIAEGLRYPSDGLNLIIHEYAHALWIEHVATSYETFQPAAADDFLKLADRELQLAAGQESHFFRDYGLTNFHEFHAVAAENFFERPDQLERQLPHVYSAMVRLYQHDPQRIR
jgi:MtfA peptidase